MRKVFIFDFDGTFYSGEHKFDNVGPTIEKNRRKFLPHISDEEYENICRENPKWMKAITGNDISKCIYSFKKKYPNLEFSVRDFCNWQNNNSYDIIIDYNQIVDIKFMENLCREYSVYVVSNSSLHHIYHYMNKIGINKNWFKGIFSNEFIEEDPSKEHYYKDILNIEKCKPHNVYIFGDSVGADLAPALHLGINAFYVDNALNIKALVTKVLENEV